MHNMPKSTSGDASQLLAALVEMRTLHLSNTEEHYVVATLTDRAGAADRPIGTADRLETPAIFIGPSFRGVGL